MKEVLGDKERNINNMLQNKCFSYLALYIMITLVESCWKW